MLESNAREFALSMARTYIAALLIENAAATQLETDAATAQRFASRGLYVVYVEPSKVLCTYNLT